MNSRKIPYQRTVFVCTHSREDGKTSCGNPGRGGVELLAKLKDAVAAAGLKGNVRVMKSGCMDFCEKGPNAFCYPEGEWLCGVKEEDVPAIIKKITGV